MKTMLSGLFKHSTLGLSKIFKTLTQWLNELSHAFHFLLSYWQPAYSFGQTSTKAPHRFRSLNPFRQSTHAYQALQFGQTATITKTRRRRTETELSATSNTETSGAESIVSRAGSSFSGLKATLRLDTFLLRLFNGLYTFWENKRLRWGMFFLLIFAPASKFLYLLFPEGGFGEYLINYGSVRVLNSIELVEGGWYWATFRMYFFFIGEYLGPVLSIVGIFFLFPKKYYPSYLIGVPFGYYLSLLVHRMFFVTDYQTFHDGATPVMTFTLLILGVVLFAVSDKVLFKENHVKRASEARIIGLINMPGMEWNDKEQLIKKEVAEVMKVDNELFIKESA